MPIVDKADKLGWVVRGLMGNGRGTSQAVAEKVARLLPDWA
jgi:hypothetical protein